MLKKQLSVFYEIMPLSDNFFSYTIIYSFFVFFISLAFKNINEIIELRYNFISLPSIVNIS